MEVMPNIGLSKLQFGMSPSEVKEILGDTLIYEEWMGGNLNDTLYYSGIVLAFDKHNAHGPLEDGKVIEIWIYSTFPVTYNGIELFGLHWKEIERILQAEGVTYLLKGPSHGDVGIHVREFGWYLRFKDYHLIKLQLFS